MKIIAIGAHYCSCGKEKYKYSIRCQTCHLKYWHEKLNIRHKVTCTFCNKEIVVKNFKMIKLKHHFCSRKCYGEWRKRVFVGKFNPNFRNGDKIKGKNNPNWKHGKSYEPYSIFWNKNFKLKLRKSYNFTCQICYHFGNFVHHIDYNKKNIEKSNLIVLCNSCHSKTNFNREHWEKVFKNKKEREI